MSDPQDNQRAAIEAMRAEAIASGETYKPKSEGGMMFWVIAVMGIVAAGTMAVYLTDPCASQRMQWFVKADGMRGCAFEARCSLNNGSMPHVPAGAGYIWFDDSASPVCRGVQF